MGARLLDQAEVRLHERSDAAHPDTGWREPLLAEFLGCYGVVERLPPIAGEPLDLAQRPEDQSARPLVASCHRFPLQLLGHHARALDLAQTGHQAGE